MAENCNCGSGKRYQDCCLLVHENLAAAETAEQLMRARYTAFTLGLIDFLYDTFHPDSRKFQNKKDIQRWASENKWMQLEILCSTEQTVEFKAHFLDANLQTEIHHEKSNFKKHRGNWHYVDGQLMS